MFTNKKREGIDTYVCAVSLYVAETPKASIKDQEPPLPIIHLALSRTVLLDSLSRNSCITRLYIPTYKREWVFLDSVPKFLRK